MSNFRASSDELSDFGEREGKTSSAHIYPRVYFAWPGNLLKPFSFDQEHFSPVLSLTKAQTLLET